MKVFLAYLLLKITKSNLTALDVRLAKSIRCWMNGNEPDWLVVVSGANPDNLKAVAKLAREEIGRI